MHSTKMEVLFHVIAGPHKGEDIVLQGPTGASFIVSRKKNDKPGVFLTKDREGVFRNRLVYWHQSSIFLPACFVPTLVCLPSRLSP